MISDAGATILFDFLSEQSCIKVIKLFSNIMKLIENEIDVTYMLTGTNSVAECLENKPFLTKFELHGFLFHHEDIPIMFRNLGTCFNLTTLSLSNNNMQDIGAI